MDYDEIDEMPFATRLEHLRRARLVVNKLIDGEDEKEDKYRDLLNAVDILERLIDVLHTHEGEDYKNEITVNFLEEKGLETVIKGQSLSIKIGDVVNISSGGKRRVVTGLVYDRHERTCNHYSSSSRRKLDDQCCQPNIHAVTMFENKEGQLGTELLPIGAVCHVKWSL